MSEDAQRTPRYTLRYQTQLAMSVRFSSGYICFSPRVDSDIVPFVRDEETGDLYLVVHDGAEISFLVTNSVDQVVALPARVGNGSEWRSLFLDSSDTNPSTMSPRSCMWDVPQQNSQAIKGYKTQGEIRPFFASDSESNSILPGGVSIMEFYVREPDPEGTMIDAHTGEILNRPGFTPKGASVTAGAAVPDQTQTTNVSYQSTAYLLARIKFITPSEALDMLRKDNPELVIDVTDPAVWTNNALKELLGRPTGFTVDPVPYVDDTVADDAGATTEDTVPARSEKALFGPLFGFTEAGARSEIEGDSQSE